MDMIFATNNVGKLKEVKEILKEFEIVSLTEAGIEHEVEEDQDSFHGNASKKAREIYEISKVPTVADDSGLCIDSFDGWPGVYTARFLGEKSTKEERNQAILDRFSTSKCQDRTARVICYLVYYDGEVEIVGIGELVGKIAHQARGKNGFGFDDIFELENGKTLAELSSEEKNEVSARYLATLDLKQKLKVLRK
ncbi:MAG: RdgB/HAM1 family non-canonical purine NTP pyrophosphatase [Bacilli bacterium]|nr:RdgB/HAM1 family non-canonical purine NTP pyrophosphatase [Bacilli bacterium]